MIDQEQDLTDRIWEVLVDAAEEGVHPRVILRAMQVAQRRYMIENIDRVVVKPGGTEG